jgi:hypothetical protein
MNLCELESVFRKKISSDDYNKYIIFIKDECNRLINLVDNCVGVTIISCPYMNDIPLNRAHEQAFLKCGGREYFYDNNGIKITEQKAGGKDTDELYARAEAEVEEFIYKYPDTNAFKDQVYNTIYPFNWTKFLKDTAKSIIDIIDDNVSKNIVLSIEEINLLMYKFSNFFEGYDKTQTNTIKNNMFVMPEDKKDKEIWYISGFTFINFIEFSKSDIKNKKQEYFINMNNLITYNIMMINEKYINSYDIDINKIYKLINDEDLQQLELVLRYSSYFNKINFKKFEDYALENWKMKSYKFFNKFISS